MILGSIPSMVARNVRDLQFQQIGETKIAETTSFQPTLGFQDLALLNPERDLSNKYKDGFVFEVWGNDIRLVMKAKGLFWFLDD